jgi:putative membrane protein
VNAATKTSEEFDMTTPEAKSANELAAERTDLAVERTMMAADRSLMAWIRTALSMISFGFTIYKLLESFHASAAALPREATPRHIGLFLTGLGTTAMLMGTIEYWHTLKRMRNLQPIPLWRPSFVMALIMSVMGLFLFVSIITKLL